MDSFFATPLQNKEPTRLFLQCHCKSWFAWGSFFAMLFQIQQHWECFCNAIAKLVFLGCFFAMPLQFQDSLGVLLQCRCKSRLVWGSCFSIPSQIQKLLGVFLQCHRTLFLLGLFFCTAPASAAGNIFAMPLQIKGFLRQLACNAIANARPWRMFFLMPLQIIVCWGYFFCNAIAISALVALRIKIRLE